MAPLRAFSGIPAELPQARLVLHHAVQPVAAVGQGLLPRAHDDAQQALTLGPAGRLLGAPVAGGLRAGLDAVTLELLLCDAGGEPVARASLTGMTLAGAVAFLAGALSERGVRGAPVLPAHPADFPRHAIGAGARFPAVDRGALRALARLHELSAPILEALSGAVPRLWPHHLDLAVTTARGGPSFTLGVSPGDGEDGLPYAYATPWPHPPREALPPLAGGGRWRTEGWFGAELPVASLDDPPQAQLADFFESALRTSAKA
ncbi:MAG: hypothetical protein QM704_01810 [Anaeromyxobacteraceae bacterium]